MIKKITMRPHCAEKVAIRQWYVNVNREIEYKGGKVLQRWRSSGGITFAFLIY